MTIEEKLSKAVKLADAMYYAAQQLTTDASYLSKAMKDWWNFKNVELQESEDEKTRKRIIALVNAHGQGMYKDDMLAWLENQGEKSSTVNIESMIEAYEQRLINQGNGVKNSPIVNMCVAAFKHGVENTLDELHLKQGETSPILSNSSNIGKDEQNPAWSEKDEKEYKYVLKFVDNILNNCGNKKDYEHCKRCYDWLKSLKQRIGG